MKNPSPDRRTDNPKKPYQSPELRIYGDLTKITSVTGGTVGANDMGGGKDKTGFA